MTRPTPDFLAILRTLHEHRVDFIVVSGVAGVLHGAPISTFDLDLVHSRKPENVDRLLAALEELDAHDRTSKSTKLKVTRAHLASAGHHLLLTEAGPLDLLGVIGHDRGYEDLLIQTIEMGVAEGLRVRVLELASLIKIKEEAAREKDQAVLAILRRTLEEKAKR